MPCTCCKARRAAESKEPRIRIPVFMPGQTEAMFLCEFCDGDALREAKTIESARLAGE